MSLPHLRLGVNIDHVATVRNARGGAHPDPMRAAMAAEAAGADGITAHLREDRRHILDADMYAIREAVTVPLNFEMAATDEMVSIACEVMPNAACIVPERREEVTTEGGLAVAGREAELAPLLSRIKASGIRLSLFIEASEAEIRAAAAVGADIVELHTGRYCHDEGARASRAQPTACGAPVLLPMRSHAAASRRTAGGARPLDPAARWPSPRLTAPTRWRPVRPSGSNRARGRRAARSSASGCACA